MWCKYFINQTTLNILGLYRNDYGTSLHLREIARAVHVDPKSVATQLKRLEKNNVIAGIQKGRNKEYSLNLGNYLTPYHMVLAEAFASIQYLDRNFEIKKLVSETGDSMGNAAILFGSFAKGTMTDESDIDILILADKKPNRSAFQAAGELINREVSVKFATEEQVLKGLSEGDPLMREIMANHVILKGIDSVCNIMWRYYARR
jgi:DNA-binding Lrp family transcriptional regulator